MGTTYIKEPRLSLPYTPNTYYDIYKLEGEHWRNKLVEAINDMLHSEEMSKIISEDHINKTPQRFLSAFDEYFWGVGKNPEDIMTLFPLGNVNGDIPQMIHVSGHSYYSMCAHHLAPFFGKMHFAYIPKDSIVGLSKIPRMMNIFARRPQVQEKLTNEIVDAFQKIVNPLGCGLLVTGTHFCMEARGVMAHGCKTTTTALRGIFTDAKVKEEFLMAAYRMER